jgi:hypothetical protein
MTNYPLSNCQSLIESYVNQYGGQVTTLEEGCLGLGLTILHDAPGMKSYVITEYFINSCTSGHKVRGYNKLPKKYKNALELI